MKNNIIEVKKLNDFFIRYFFGLEGHEDLLLSFINAIMIDSNFATFVSVEIINPFNLSEKANNKESIVDLKAVTEDGIIVIIEIQTYSTKNFFERTLYYWSKNYSNILKKGEDYPELKPVISINLIDDILFDKTDNRMHTCYLLKEKNTNKILTDHIQLHYIEIPKFNNDSNITTELKNWILFLKSNKEEDMSQLLKEDTIFEKAMKKYNYFTDNEDLINEYDRREAYLVYQASLMRGAKEDGFEEGEKNKAISMATAMKKDGADINLISKYTGLTIDEIKKL
ncbi:Rpn family recombination-promoting nuclease/putative transposase [Brachyspira aalborgi]|uniref:Rpn family recombination-promoting nuclease/putative transposase n=1 Tax=Brachyspira aalborgi TaxID=29522 RepID=A0A5C8GLR2_9SPIR|nr:Rpn family recombination-promoting nuclease/putative transposase [Brachyspira aalborgi]TXJ61828.1 Rpn family recombination-promoting nuclease/putative transposase [Brachyspira aalborgi]